MSQIFYESDYLTITGSGWKFTGWTTWDNVLVTGTIRLIFSIHINWKLKTFFHEFDLERWEVYSTIECNGTPENYYFLKDWTAWVAIHNTLQSLWYISDRWVWVISEWVSKVKYDCDNLWVNSPISNNNVAYTNSIPNI